MPPLPTIAETIDAILNEQEPNFLRLYLNPHTANVCLALDRYARTTWPIGRDEDFQSFLANGIEEAISGALKLLRCHRSASDRESIGLILDPSDRLKGFASADLSSGDRVAFLPGLTTLSGPMDGLREADRLPRRMREKERRLRQVVAELEQRFMRSPTPDEVAAALGGDEASVADHYAAVAFSSLGYLDEELPDDGDGEGGGASRLERIADEGAADPVERAEAEERRRHLMAALARLSERERRILWAVYQEDYTLTEVAKALRLSVSQVGRIHAHAILRLRGLMSRYVAQSRRDTPQAPRTASDRPSAQAGSVPQGRAPPAQTSQTARGRWNR